MRPVKARGLVLVATVAPPEGVSSAMVSQGETYFKGIGLCFACHGPDGKGIQGVGADLTDSEWTHTDGSFDDLVRRILRGVPPEESDSGVMMPPKGGSQITDEQARAIAAYVWSRSRRERGRQAGG